MKIPRKLKKKCKTTCKRNCIYWDRKIYKSKDIRILQVDCLGFLWKPLIKNG